MANKEKGHRGKDSVRKRLLRGEISGEQCPRRHSTVGATYRGQVKGARESLGQGSRWEGAATSRPVGSESAIKETGGNGEWRGPHIPETKAKAHVECHLSRELLIRWA